MLAGPLGKAIKTKIWPDSGKRSWSETEKTAASSQEKDGKDRVIFAGKNQTESKALQTLKGPLPRKGVEVRHRRSRTEHRSNTAHTKGAKSRELGGGGKGERNGDKGKGVYPDKSLTPSGGEREDKTSPTNARRPGHQTQGGSKGGRRGKKLRRLQCDVKEIKTH